LNLLQKEQKDLSFEKPPPRGRGLVWNLGLFHNNPLSREGLCKPIPKEGNSAEETDSRQIHRFRVSGLKKLSMGPKYALDTAFGAAILSLSISLYCNLEPREIQDPTWPFLVCGQNIEN